MESKNPTAPAPDGVPVPVKADPDWHWEVTPVISLRDYFIAHAPSPPPEWFGTLCPGPPSAIWRDWPSYWADMQLAERDKENPDAQDAS